MAGVVKLCEQALAPIQTVQRNALREDCVFGNDETARIRNAQKRIFHVVVTIPGPALDGRRGAPAVRGDGDVQHGLPGVCRGRQRRDAAAELSLPGEQVGAVAVAIVAIRGAEGLIEFRP